MTIVPVSIGGSLLTHVGTDIVLRPSQADAYTVLNPFLSLREHASGADFTADLRNATGGGGSGITVTIADGNTESTPTAATLSVAAGETLYLRVTAAVALDLELSGYVEAEGVSSSPSTYLTTLARVKLEHGITVSTYDAELTDLMAGVSDRIERYCGRKFRSHVRTDYLTALRGSSVLSLPTHPIIGTPTVEEDGSALTVTTDFRVEDAAALLVRMSGGVPISWNWGSHAIKVVGTYGYSTIPDDLDSIAAEMTRMAFRQNHNGQNVLGMTGRSVDTGGEGSYITPDAYWAGVARPRLDNWRAL